MSKPITLELPHRIIFLNTNIALKLSKNMGCLNCNLDLLMQLNPTNTLTIKRIVHLFWIVHVHLHIDNTYTHIYMDMEMHGKENHILMILN